jgi:hypothetical protein
MRTERWIVTCAIFAVFTFFGGLTLGAKWSGQFTDAETTRARELEKVVNSMESREAVLIAALGGNLPPDLPPKHVPPFGKAGKE